MSMMQRISRTAAILFLMGIFSDLSIAHGDWSYDTGRDDWCSIAKTCCNQHQSPINLLSEVEHSTVTPLTFKDYDKVPQSMGVSNNGHTANVVITSDDVKPVVFGGDLNGNYVFHSLHFHWGSTNIQGSEHTIDGKNASLELHLVHYREKFKSLDHAKQATEDPSALAVIGVLFDVGDKADSEAMSFISRDLESIINKDQSVSISKAFSLASLLPKKKASVFRYLGSLTTPGCSEAVVWTVYRDISSLSNEQISAFRKLQTGSKDDVHSSLMVDNFRYVQPLNDRQLVILDFET